MNQFEQPRKPLLEVRNLSLRFPGQLRPVVDRVSFSIHPGETLGLVGGSGAGKSSIARLIMRLLKADSGEIRFYGDEVLNMDARQSKRCRRNIQVVFQEPSASLSPRRTVGQTLLEPLNHFGIGDTAYRRGKVNETLLTVGLEQDILQRYPHQFSSGQQQRIAIARALVAEPELVIADEAVSSLDVSIQAQILHLIRNLQRDRGIAFLFISHDLGVIRQIADQVAVIYRGRLLEQSPAARFFAGPAHPYSRSLLSFAKGEQPPAFHDQWQLENSAAMAHDSPVCVFLRNCPRQLPVCEQQEPAEHHFGQENRHGSTTHCVKCHLYNETNNDEYK